VAVRDRQSEPAMAQEPTRRLSGAQIVVEYLVHQDARRSLPRRGACARGGANPLAIIGRHRRRIIHLHLKDVAAEPLALRDGRPVGFESALRGRISAPLGSGILDLPAVLAALVALQYDGWLMVEQDTSWEPPSEAAAIGSAA
jgi:sugar phosphate isomerase/epimerase